MTVIMFLSEILLVSLSTGYLPAKVSFLIWDRYDFFTSYFSDNSFEALVLYFIDKPLFKIEAIQMDSASAIWGLHYYSYTLLAHLLVAIVYSYIITRSALNKNNWRGLPVLGSAMLILSSLFLYLSSCCSVGGNWIFHSWFLSVIFNPLTASESLLESYTLISEWLIWMQVLMALTGIYLMFSKLKKYKLNV